MEHPELLHGMAELLEEASQRRRLDQQRLDSARLLTEEGRDAEAVAAYQSIFRTLKDDAEAWHELAVLQLKLGDAGQAKASLIESLRADVTRTRAHYDFGRTCAAHPGSADVERQYLSALGLALDSDSSLSAAEAQCRRQLPTDPTCDEYLRLGRLQTANGHVPEAFETFRAALAAGYLTAAVFDGLAGLAEISGQVQASHVYRGHARYFGDENALAVESYRSALHIGPADPIVYARLAWSSAGLKNYQEAIATCEEGIEHHPGEADLYCRLVELLQADGRIEASQQIAATASARFPDNFELKRLAALTLPMVYRTVEDVARYRKQFAEGLAGLGDQMAAAAPGEALSGAWHNFYLAYQGCDDKALQVEFGALLHRIMRANHAQWSRRVALPPVDGGEKIRVGYLSTHLHTHTVAKLFLGWLQAHDRSHIEVFAYHLGARIDPMTHQYQRAADHFRHLPLPVENIARQVTQDRLHVLVFLDIGMDTTLMKLASLYLAPVQCVAWGHPVTTGLPTIDYFISSELMEPQAAEQHYSETLIRLPGTGVNVPPPYLEQPRKTRVDFGLAHDDRVFLTPQSVFKYLPQHDEVFCRIADRVPAAKFIFIRAGSDNVTNIFQRRLLAAFESHGLDGHRFLVFLPQQSHRDYLDLNCAADVFLDQPGWSGGMTALEALGCGLPVVTWPGAFMRGRHAMAFLRRMELDSLIESDLDGFVDLAVRAGTDTPWRHELKDQIAARKHLLFDDTSCVRALEQFYARCTTAMK